MAEDHIVQSVEIVDNEHNEVSDCWLFMDIDLYSREEIITAVRAARRPVAFMVGSPLSTDVGGGVPGVDSMLELAYKEIGARARDELSRFKNAISGKSGGDAYQAAMKWLQANLTQDAVNSVVREAVLLARKPEATADFQYDGAARDWYLPEGTRQLAKLICSDRERFPGPILTTNFDPLLSLAIDSYGGHPRLRIIHSDGGLNQDVKRVGEIEVVHLHGFWRDSDTLHTPMQLTAPRPRLKDSLKEILRQRMLIVVAYGGWDDVFADALAEVTLDESAQVSILWCFRENNADEVARKYRSLLERVQPAIIRGRFVAYGGIDCHSIFGEIAGALPVARVSAGSVASPIAGWRLIEPTFLDSLTPLTPEAILRYFDGAAPSWGHAVSDAVPRRLDVAKIVTRLTQAQGAKAACVMQLIRAAGGEGKSTILLQAAAQATRADGWTVLWRPSPTEGLPPARVVELDTSRQWLIVADDADNLIDDLVDSARRLSHDGRTNIHFLLAARDTDWKNAKGDQKPWGTWLTQEQDIVLRGITRQDAKMVVQAWGKYGSRGLRQLAKHGNVDQQVDALHNAVRDAKHQQWQRGRPRKSTDGSFFGGLLDVRFGQADLQAHVREFLQRLRDMRVEGGPSLFHALLYVAACHGAGIQGISEIVLADLVGVPRDWLQSRVLRPLGEEAAAVYSGGHVFTRHSKVAAAILVEADQTFGEALTEVWTRLVIQTAKTGQEPGIRVGPTFSQIVHAGPRLQDALPAQLTVDHRKAIAIAAAKADVMAEPERLSPLTDLGRTYRNAGMIEEAVAVFVDNLKKVDDKSDYQTNIRGYWYEWSVCEGVRGRNRQNALADAWLGSISISDALNPAPIDYKRAELSCEGLGIAFSKLARPRPDCVYARACRAAVHLGRHAHPNPRTIRGLDKSDSEADKLHTPHPRDVAEAIDWLTTAANQVTRDLNDPFLRNLAVSRRVSFVGLRGLLKD